METRMKVALTKEQYARTKIVPLDTIVENNLTFSLGKEKFEIKQLVNIGHTKGDLVIYLPHKRALFVGDLIFNGRLTSLRDGSIIGSIDAVEKIEAYHAVFIVSGHGYEVDRNATKIFKAYLHEIKNEVSKAIDEDIGMDEITKKVAMPQYKSMKLYDVLHARNVLDAYKEIEMIEEDD
jgi:glyoxylase-like metal-dependent hydrolase (beta-lactamase superfamily II)